MSFEKHYDSWLPPEESDRFLMGSIASWNYLNNPKQVLFHLARYKFVSKVLTGVENVLEVGCGDGFGTPIVSDVCSRLVATDADENFVRQAQQAGSKVQRHFEVYLHNWIDPPNPFEVQLRRAISVGCFGTHT